MNWIKCVPFVGTTISAVECVGAVIRGDGKGALWKLGETLVDGAMDATIIASGGLAAILTTPGKIAGKTAGKAVAGFAVKAIAGRALVGAVASSVADDKVDHFSGGSIGSTHRSGSPSSSRSGGSSTANQDGNTSRQQGQRTSSASRSTDGQQGRRSSSASRSSGGQQGADPPRQTPDPSRGLNTDPTVLRSIEEANKMIVKAMIKYIRELSSTTLPQAARDFIITQLQESEALNQFHLNSTASWGVVQVDHEFEGVTGGGERTWEVLIRIDVDNPPQDPHMGYEIYINRGRVQSGHVYVNNLTIGRPGLGEDDVLTTNILGLGNVNFKDKDGNSKGKAKWKCTSTRYKRY